MESIGYECYSQVIRELFILPCELRGTSLVILAPHLGVSHQSQANENCSYRFVTSRYICDVVIHKL